MKAELKASWLAALRSGEYKQGTGQLRAKNKFCCLGVLCDVVDPKGWSLGAHHGAATAISVPVMDATGIADRYAEFKLNDGPLKTKLIELFENQPGMLEHVRENKYINLAALNDAGVPFEVIADVIEECF